MSVKVENLEHNMAKLTFEVAYEEFDKAINKVYNKQKGQISVPGFRKGKVPRHMVEKMYGAEVFYDEAVNEVLPDAYAAAVEESGLDVTSRPAVDMEPIVKGQPVVFFCEVAVKPEVKLGKYKGVKVEKLDKTVTDEELEADIEAELKRASREVSVERPVENGDVAVIDYEGFVDGVAFEGGKGEAHPLEIGSGSFIPGFEEALIGAKAGEDVDVNVTFPEEYHSEDLAGKAAVFKCHVIEVKAKEIPLLDDDFADDAGFDSVDEYKADRKKALEERKLESVKNAQVDEAILKIVEDSEMDIPEAMIEYQVENMINDMATRMSYQGLSFDQYLQFSGMTMDKLKEQARPDAEARTKSSLVLEAIAAAEKLEATDEDVEKRLAEMAEQYGMDVENIKNALGEEMDSLKKDIAVQKAVDFIFENVSETAAKKTTKKTTKKAEAEAEAETTEE